jgi:hypothetical protein
MVKKFAAEVMATIARTRRLRRLRIAMRLRMLRRLH